MTDAYQKAYEREKLARLAAEKLLDEKTREVQSSINMVQHQFNDLMRQKKEADYLLAVARLAQPSKEKGQQEKELDDVVNEYMSASLIFMGAQISRFSYLRDHKIKMGKVIKEEGDDENLPSFLPEHYKTLYQLEKRKIWKVSDLKHPELELALEALGVNRIGFVPIKCFGKVATVCEFYLPEEMDFKTEVLDQCEVSAYQIGRLLEDRINRKKLESSYQEITASHEKLKQAQSQLVQSEKMASLGQLAAGVAHEINNPIGFVMSNIGTLNDYSDALSQYVAMTKDIIASSNHESVSEVNKLDKEQDFDFIVEDIKEIMSDCADGLRRVKDIVSNLKSFARSDEEDTAEFDINECIENTLKVVWNELKYKVTLHKDYQDDLPLVKGHEGQVGQVVMNMLVNAAQAIEDHGEIFVTTLETDKSIQIQVQDTGKGMSDEVKAKIFDPFYTTKGVNEGTGLGLSISYGIIESHGGEIRVESEEGVGTLFKISLPKV